MSSHARRCTPLALVTVILGAVTALLVGAGTAGAAPAPAAAPPAAAPAPVAAPAPAVALTAGTPCDASADACVDLSSQQAWLTDGQGNVTYGPVGALGGTKKYPTPTGTFSVDYKDADHVSNLYDADMPFSVFFAPAIAFHTGSLSQRSHGCIHLGKTASKRFFANLSPGDTVQVVS
ncbi:L,D-transpeptidase-like protein [Actinomycetospora succinea]|uniref:L,D-transpeptidase-like protein n=1 Tax=Actinomycetospora succinea TaxID=663603 RepID=A0A4V3D9R3_9PSEU|nr:L,D-transpeptidase [Actinomycetospora succinea]TDQ58402.1 L,D-transpeptidase-like protein [Actinomycetospora succinea]